MRITNLKGVGERTAQLLAKHRIYTLEDLLFHLPYRYQDRTHISPIASLRVGDYAVVEVQMIQANITYGKKRSLVCRVTDATGELQLRFFHFSMMQKDQLIEGVTLRCFGELRHTSSGQLSMIHPEYQKLQDKIDYPVEESLTPIYPSINGISQKVMRKLIQQALKQLTAMPLNELLPDSSSILVNSLSLNDALAFLHAPSPEANVKQLEEAMHPAQQRLIFEELMTHQLSQVHARALMQKNEAVTCLEHIALKQRFIDSLSFNLTDAQNRVINEVSQDLTLAKPMMRLVLGDVGSGKTIVAAIAALQIIANGYQVALMVPTELLAEQHFHNFTQWLVPLNLTVSLLVGKQTIRQRRTILTEIADGTADIIIGTHALFQKEIVFKQLALVIIDEQHRFGVNQRLALMEKGRREKQIPHQLVMSATPIPRTLYMTAYADLDVSIIDELPPGRIPIKTVAIGNHRREEVIASITQQCQQKRQVYWVCTLIEESESLQCQAAQESEQLLTEQLPDLTIGLVHGRLKPAEKASVMNCFLQGNIDVLVATTVIEVGVNVPNASLMVIENPERLGLAQLHQLRGRVGRGNSDSYCMLLYQSPLTAIAKQRLAILRATNDGFKIAEKDLQLRGPGEVLGTQQTGIMQFRIANLLRDQALIAETKKAAEQILKDNPEFIEPLMQRWLSEQAQYRQI